MRSPARQLCRGCLLGAIPLLCACFVVTGCGATHTVTVAPPAPPCPITQRACISVTAKARGPANLVANITELMAVNQRRLKDIKASCPPEPSPPHYPVKCRFTATDTGEQLTAAQLKTHLGRLLARRHAVEGTITIQGVYTRTMTYVYALNYGPVR
jgi:hypothetical protein